MKRAPPLSDFKYTSEQWAEIDASICALRVKKVSRETRAELLRAARQYDAESKMPAPADRAKRWKRIAKLADKLLSELVPACESRQAWIIDPENRRLESGELLRWEQALLEIGLAGNIRIRDRDFHFDDDDPRSLAFDPQDFTRQFYYDVIVEWQRLGGSLGITRHPASGKIGGKFPRFFFAVVRPVMNKETPASETLRHIRNWYNEVEMRMQAALENLERDGLDLKRLFHARSRKVWDELIEEHHLKVKKARVP